MLMREKPEYMFAIGMFSLAIALLLDRFAGQAPIIDFFVGVFTGLSLTLNLAYLIRYRIEKNSKFNQKNSVHCK